MPILYETSSMGIDRTELREGLAETRKYLLAHHPPSEFHRCYAPVIAGRRIHVCARCLGVYPGIAAGFLAYVLLPWSYDPVLVVALLPLPALVDWSVTTFREWSGYNPVRTTTGALLGCGYGLGLSFLFLESRLGVLAVGIGYALLAGLLLSLSW